ncbi:hypothetical protein ABFV51_27520, partial [Pseudomonas asgharzadehiana]|uniref:hypothetical protein n=1 Tax=Pseudomonas TaxID=286 RepID=UPI002270058D
PKVVGSNPAPATKHQKRLLERVAFFVLPGCQLPDPAGIGAKCFQSRSQVARAVNSHLFDPLVD